jgi:adenosylhomocysteinase
MKNIEKLLASYISSFPEEKERLSLLCDQITSEDDIFSRKNFNGHVTASAFVYNVRKKKFLLIFHKALQKWIQPGGHIEKSDLDLASAAKREVLEETGLKNIHVFQLKNNEPYVLDIDTHWIPENIHKKEPGHYHHDFRFIFYTTEDFDTQFNDDWVSDIAWRDIDQINTNTHYKNIALKIHNFLDQDLFLTHAFFQSVLSSQQNNDVAFIIISHIIPSSIPFITFLHTRGLLWWVFAKPNSIHRESLLHLQENNIHVFVAGRDIKFYEELKTCIELSTKKVILIDIGWYFSEIQKKLKDTFDDKIVWIVEDTENGHQKYVNNIFPVYSLARSSLKDNEDYFVGHSIVYSVESLLKEKNMLLEEKKYGVIGFWKVWRWIADRLSLFSKNVTVCEKNPLRKLHAHRLGYALVWFDDIIKNVDILFCATWSKIFSLSDFHKLRSNTILATATSSDDEFDTSFLLSVFSKKPSNIFSSSYVYTSPSNTFTLLNDGRAVNFLHNAIVWRYIYLVQSWLLRAGYSLLSRWERERWRKKYYPWMNRMNLKLQVCG